MGKIKTEGRVTLEFEPDLYEISMLVKAESNTSGAAITAGKEQTEKLLQLFQEKLNIKPEQITIKSESVDSVMRCGNNENEEYFRFHSGLSLNIPANNKLREAVIALLSEMANVHYSVDAKLANDNEQKQTVIEAAMQCAKEKAERAAASIHHTITGFEEICTDGIKNTEELFRGAAPADVTCKAINRAAELQNPKIKITGEVAVTWLTEPLT